MIRPFTFLAAMLFCLSGAYLFAVKHQAQTLDDQLAATAQATRLDEQRIRVLQAQWALEADPSRLASLAARFTNLQPMKPGQLVTLAALRTSLPAPNAAVPGHNPADTAPSLPPPSALAPAPPPTPIASATPAQSQAQTLAQPLAHAPARLAALPASPPPAPPHPAAKLAAASPAHHKTHPHNVAVAMLPASPSRLAVLADTPARPAPAASAPAYTPPPAAGGGSLLGMAQNLSPGSGTGN